MNNNSELNSVSVVQLKRWLEVLNMPTTGTKDELILRLNTMSNTDEFAHAIQEEMHNFVAASKLVKTGQQQEEQLLLGLYGKGDDANNQAENLTDSFNEDEEKENQQENEQLHVEVRKTERDVDIVSELRQLMQSVELHLLTPKQTRNSTIQGHAEVEEMMQSRNNQNRMANENGQGENINGEMSWRMAVEALSVYDGQTCARMWIAQMKNISNIYGITGTQMRMLFVSKIKGKVNTWLYENPSRALQPIDDLCDQMISMFGETQSKLEKRRKFESRIWQSDEKFGKYLDEKLMLAQNVSLDQEELLDRIIEGIPNGNLRNQARIQCFRDVAHMRRAFAEVYLPKKRTNVPEKETASVDRAAGDEIRCHNCNARGHFARNCLKPKRQPGSCFACGEMGHWVGQCAQNKSNKRADNNYNAS